MDPEAVTARTPRPLTRAMLAQSWRDAAFLHWEIDPEAVGPLLPPGVTVDLFGGVAHVGLIAFRMVRTRLFGSPPVPWLGTFCETNVRLYSVDAHGRRAVVFRWMAAERLLPALIGRAALGLPYRWSRMTLDRDGKRFTYTCATPASRVLVEAGAPIERPSPLELYLTSRWGLHTRAFGRTLHLANEHEPWPLHTAELLHCDDRLLAAAGIPGIVDRPPDSVLYSPGVHARFGPARTPLHP
ncbi:YqjF family protein [Phytomonospora endophytica]|uniref:DUF2071 domain-containing protein n=1 Tax=Phytomonospora endophytica TaxID=714109 RepID=A0A841FT88_9ACTN|nr:DUF2071 domain-containing protein [Phytomonospora endophytica]MBB6036958.1 hypothetical protein [Phytomonospora endophytica]GIG68011.1 hypothetical protein Pen01_43060 [Phytomonospora endophytica]